MPSDDKKNSLHEDEERLRSILCSKITTESPDAVLACNRDLEVVLYNRGAETLFGLTKEEVLHRPVTMLLSDQFTEKEARVMLRPDFDRVSLCLDGKRRDGSLFPADASIFRITIDGRIYFGLVVHDVSQRQEFQKQLEQSRDTLAREVLVRSADLERINRQHLETLRQQHAILDNIPDMAWLKDKESRFIAVNHAFAKMCNRDPQWLVGKTDYDAWPKDLAERYREDDAEVIRTRKRKIVEELSATPDGQRPWIETAKTPIFNEQGEIIGTTGIARDISSRKEAERERQRSQASLEGLVAKRTCDLEQANRHLQEQMARRQLMEAAIIRSEARSKAILEAIPDLIFQIDQKSTLVMVKGPPTELPLPSEQMLQKRIEQVFPQKVAVKLKKACEQVLKTSKAQVVEYDLAMPGGMQFYEARMVLLGHDEVLALVRNVTERMRFEQMKTDFINRAAHELRTPIATISLMADLIQEGGSPEELNQYWAALRNELQRQRTLMEEILTMGRLESGELTANITALDLPAVLESAIHSVRPLANARHIKIKVVSDVKGISVQADRTHLLQVFINLLDNAIKFSHERGQIEISAGSDQGGVAVSIKDQGIGIPAADMPKLFNRFSRASNADLAEIPGSGVGLYLVKAMLEKGGGKIKVHSTLGEGSTFTVWLPVATF